MKHIFRISIVLVLALTGIFYACNKKKPDFIGPAIIAAPPGFEVKSFSASPASVDFTGQPVVYTAELSSSVSWVMTITGKTSGAVYTTQGISSTVNVTWDGSMDGIQFFQTGEETVATLSFIGTPLTKSANNVVIAKAADFTKCGVFAPFGDFEVSSKVSPSYGWNRFNGSIPSSRVQQGVSGITSRKADYNGDSVYAPQGKGYYYIKGIGAADQTVFVSGLSFGAYKATTTDTLMFTHLPADPERVWVNMYVYGTGDANAGIELEYQEEDFDGDSVKYGGKDDDAFVTYITLNHVGWKLFSFKYSNLTPSKNKDFGGSGNHIHEPNHLYGFDLVLTRLKDPNSPVEVYFDYPIITVDKPFVPCKH